MAGRGAPCGARGAARHPNIFDGALEGSTLVTPTVDDELRFLLRHPLCAHPDPRDWVDDATPLWRAAFAQHRDTQSFDPFCARLSHIISVDAKAKAHALFEELAPAELEPLVSAPLSDGTVLVHVSSDLYVHGFFWATMVTSGIGYDIMPVTLAEALAQKHRRSQQLRSHEAALTLTLPQP